MSVNSKMTAIANATRALDGSTAALTLDGIASKLGVEKTNIAAALAAITEKGVEVPDGSTSDALASLIASIEAGGGAGEIFGTSKYEVGSVIGGGSVNLIVPKPTWVSDTDKLNAIAFTLPTYAWDASYFTVLFKLQREAVTVGSYVMNDSDSFTKNVITIREISIDKLSMQTTTMTYSIYGYEYFYILWENE